MAGPAARERARLSGSGQAAPGKRLRRAADLVPQRRARKVRGYFGVRGAGNNDEELLARAGDRRFVERRKAVRGGEQHECRAEPAGEPGADGESLGGNPDGGDEIEVRSGSSYDSQNDMRVHFGLGAATKIDWVEIRWLSGLTERFEGLAVDKIHVLKEGTGTKSDGV